MRTNIDIDDKLMTQAMKAPGAKTKRAAIDKALRKLVALRFHEKKVEEVFRLQRSRGRKRSGKAVWTSGTRNS